MVLFRSRTIRDFYDAEWELCKVPIARNAYFIIPDDEDFQTLFILRYGRYDVIDPKMFRFVTGWVSDRK